MAKDWRGDKYLRKLEALMIAADEDHTLLIAGNGDVLQPDEGIAAIGSGGNYALASARSLARHTDMDAKAICREALKTAAEICVYTNDHISMEVIERDST
jgi:ATP-dependent HslUV protease subunit HslV